MGLQCETERDADQPQIAVHFHNIPKKHVSDGLIRVFRTDSISRTIRLVDSVRDNAGAVNITPQETGKVAVFILDPDDWCPSCKSKVATWIPKSVGDSESARTEYHCPNCDRLAPKHSDVYFLDNLLADDRDGTWRLVVAAILGDDADLGCKGVRGILKSVATRKAYLGNPEHRVRFIYLPRHCSWLNQIEIWFGTLKGKVTKLGSFTSVEQLCNKILTFIDYYNEALAKPYNWTYTGRVACE